jgi:membrane-associated phospholipid phosphatase
VTSKHRVIVALAALAWASPSRSEGPSALNVSWAADGSITAATLTVWGVSDLAKGTLAPPACRWCGVDGVDASVRNALVWSNKKTAATLSDALQFAVPVGIAGYDVLATSGDVSTASKDVLVVAEAVAISGVVTQGVKYASARIRPYAYFGHTDAARDDHVSFWSGHAVVAFSAAAAGGSVARMRGYAGWRWVYAAGFSGAALTGYFRMASDKHWLTDVLASGAVGTGIGVLVPWLHRSRPGRTSFRVLPAPSGIAIGGEF